MEGFFLASRSLGSLLIFVSLAASWIGASSTLVTVDEAYSQGVSSFWLMGLPAVLTALAFAFIFAAPIRRLPILTLPDLVEREEIRPPTIIIVGQVVSLQEKLSWFGMKDTAATAVAPPSGE